MALYQRVHITTAVKILFPNNGIKDGYLYREFIPPDLLDSLLPLIILITFATIIVLKD